MRIKNNFSKIASLKFRPLCGIGLSIIVGSWYYITLYMFTIIKTA